MSRPAWFMPPRPVLVLPVLLLLALPALSARATLFRLPLDKPEEIDVDFWGVIHADHDPADGGPSGAECLAFDGSRDFPNCYDAHDGTDYLLTDSWDAMDEERVRVLAAAFGEVTSVADGNYDRCHVDFAAGGVSCDGHPMIGNHVKIRHADGMQSWYWHFKKDTILVRVGDWVDCGDPLGFVGSSGYSTGPHLHFEVRTAQDEWIDPYAGPISQPESYWVQQVGPYGLPGPYCEGEEVPIEPEPDPEMAGEDVATVPDVAEDVPQDPGALDAGSQEDAAPAGDDGPPTDAQDPGLAADPGGHSDEGMPADAATDGFDRFGGLPGAAGWGCAAAGGDAPGTMPLLVMALVLAILRSRRRA